MAYARCRKRRPIAGPASVCCCLTCCFCIDIIAERKVGCDRALPCCLNCGKGQRTCQGYGLRLAWPDKQDGRRKQKRYEAKDQAVATKYLLQRDGRLAFLNTVNDDLDGSKLSVRDLVMDELISVIANSIPMPRSFFPVKEQDGMLLSHCMALTFLRA